MAHVELKPATERDGEAIGLPRGTDNPVADERSFIEVRNLVVTYGPVTAVRHVSFDVQQGEQLTLLGPSGCGKTTTLRSIAGLETPQAGEIIIDGEVAFSSTLGVNLPPEKRQLSMVFQSYAIWPHMTVFENVAYGLRARRLPKDQIRQRVGEVLRMVGMADYAERPATRLSGGQQQRVAVARAYAFYPKALLLDEPLSNLDTRLRNRMRDELKELQRSTRLTTIYVTHDQEEAMALSDRIIVMRDGLVEQRGDPLEIYESPKNAFVANFIGAANIIAGELVSSAGDRVRLMVADQTVVECVSRKPSRASNGTNRVSAALRAVYPRLSRTPHSDGRNTWSARIAKRILLGDVIHYTVQWPGGVLKVHTLPSEVYEEGEQVSLFIPPDRLVLLDEDPGPTAGAVE